MGVDASRAAGGTARPLREMTASTAGAVRAVFTDIDDTLTTDGKLTADAYTALWRLSEAGVRVVAVTGRPAGWCDMIAREWPADAVVGENGAFAMRARSGRVETIFHPEARHEYRERLAELEREVLATVPDVRVAGDQSFRWFDLAIDFAEEEPRLDISVARRVRDLCVARGAVAKISSIHVNAWYGSYSKLEMARQVTAEWLSLTPEDVVYVGDSPNDEPLFAGFPLSVGVANLAVFLDDLDTQPTYITARPSGAGFAELADRLIAAQSG